MLPWSDSTVGSGSLGPGTWFNAVQTLDRHHWRLESSRGSRLVIDAAGMMRRKGELLRDWAPLREREPVGRKQSDTQQSDEEQSKRTLRGCEQNESPMNVWRVADLGQGYRETRQLKTWTRGYNRLLVTNRRMGTSHHRRL